MVIITLITSILFTVLLILETNDNSIDKIESKNSYIYPIEKRKSSIEWDIATLTILSACSWAFFFYLIY
jgi:hypothetical protein